MMYVEYANVTYCYKFDEKAEVDKFCMQNRNKGWRFNEPKWNEKCRQWFMVVSKPYLNHQFGY